MIFNNWFNKRNKLDQLIDEISCLKDEVRALGKNRECDHGVTKSLHELNNKVNDLKTQGIQIMSAISEFAGRVTVFNDKIDASIADLQTDVKSLADQIAALQASAGAITPEDQAALDGIESRAASITSKLEALDALNPPPAP